MTKTSVLMANQMMRERQMSEKRKQTKVELNIDENHHILVEIEEIGGYLVDINDPFLRIHDNGILRSVFTMNKILEYCKENVSVEKYLRVEKYFMERES